MTKILFLCLWYSAIYPGVFFVTSIALFINYFTDRFSLLRTWKRAPQLGTKISKFSRRYFFSLAFVFMAIMTSMFWACYPFDNLCEGSVSGMYEGEFRLEDGEYNVTVSVTKEDMIYDFCLQDLLLPGYGFTFPFVPKQQEGEDRGDWMTDEQEEISRLFGWSAVGVVVLVLLLFLKSWYKSISRLFYIKPKVGATKPRILPALLPTFTHFL